MNIAALQTMAGMNVQNMPNNVQIGQAQENTFGSVLGNITKANATAIVPKTEPSEDAVVDEAIAALLNATTIEELEAAIQELNDKSGGAVLHLETIIKIDGIEQFAEQLELDPERVIESLSALLENEGQSEMDLVNLSDFWTVLETIDKNATSFFKRLTDALEVNGVIPKKQAIELLTLLKVAELIAPKTDLLLKQEQQVFALQSNLAIAVAQFETDLRARQQSKQPLFSLMEPMHSVRITTRIDVSQSMREEASLENGEKQMIRQTVQQSTPQSTNPSPKVVDETAMKVSQDASPSTNSSKETTQQAVSNTVGAVAAVKGEFSITELGNQNQTRSEALVREMQTIFKRSSFGQTAGTNRLLIKLYPEHLGQVRIELLQTNGVMTARILASTALGKEMLDSQLHQLRQAFVHQNIQVERIDISQTLQDTARNDREQPFNQQFGKQQQEAEQQHKQNSEEDKTFQEYMIELEV